LERDHDSPPESYEAVVHAVRQTIPCVILDLPHVWQPWVKAALLAADDVVIVATPDLTSLRNAKNIIDLLKGARPNDAPPRLVINQIGIPKRPEIPTKDFAETMGVDPSAVIAFEPALFGQAANNGQMVVELQPKAPVAEAIRQLCRAITGRTMQGADAKNTNSIFSFLKGKKRA
jgi:pilus assembly protein CpaE